MGTITWRVLCCPENTNTHPLHLEPKRAARRTGRAGPQGHPCRHPLQEHGWWELEPALWTDSEQEQADHRRLSPWGSSCLLLLTCISCPMDQQTPPANSPRCPLSPPGPRAFLGEAPTQPSGQACAFSPRVPNPALPVSVGWDAHALGCSLEPISPAASLQPGPPAQPLPPSLSPSLPDPCAWASLDLGHPSPSRVPIPGHPVGWCCRRSACGVLSVQGD